MWLSEGAVRRGRESTEAALSISSGQEAELLRPANVLRLPKNGETRLLLLCSDGSEIELGTVGGTTPTGLEEGELYISTDSAIITIKNDGAIVIEGDVSISGSLRVNGVSI